MHKKHGITHYVIRVLLIGSLLSSSFSASVMADDVKHPHAIGSSLFLLGNLLPGDPPKFFQLSYAYRLSKTSNIMVEAITWNYYNPLGAYEASEKYPGKIKAYGLGIGYQHFWWKNLYTTAKATPFYQQFIDKNDQYIQSGWQLYLQARLGYRFEFFGDRWYIEPSVAFNHWPVNTGFPEAFKAVEKGKNNYYLFEPGLDFGFTF